MILHSRQKIANFILDVSENQNFLCDRITNNEPNAMLRLYKYVPILM